MTVPGKNQRVEQRSRHARVQESRNRQSTFSLVDRNSDDPDGVDDRDREQTGGKQPVVDVSSSYIGETEGEESPDAESEVTSCNAHRDGIGGAADEEERVERKD